MRFCFVHVQSWRPSLTRTVILPGELSPSRCTYPSAAKERHGRRIYQSHSSLAWIAIVQRTESRVIIRALRDEGWPEHAALSPEPSGVMVAARDGTNAAAAEESERWRRVQSPRPQVLRGPKDDSSSSSDEDAAEARRATSSSSSRLKLPKVNERGWGNPKPYTPNLGLEHAARVRVRVTGSPTPSHAPSRYCNIRRCAALLHVGMGHVERKIVRSSSSMDPKRAQHVNEQNRILENVAHVKPFFTCQRSMFDEHRCTASRHGSIPVRSCAAR